MDPHFLADADVLDDLVAVALFARQQGRHELHRVVGLQIGRLVGDHRVGSAVRLVEPVSGEGLHLIEDLLRLGLRDPVLQGACHELRLFLLHFGGVLLAHGLAEGVRLAHGVARQGAGDLHHLLLVEDDSVGLLEDGLELGVGVDDLAALAVPLADELVHHATFERAGPVQRQEGHHVAESIGFERPQVALHPVRLQLEDPVGVGVAQQLIGGRVVEGQVVQVQLLAARALDVAQAVIDDRQVPQAQEVHLDQAHGGRVVHVELADHLVAVHPLQRDQFGKGLAGDHHAGGMDAGVAGQALAASGQVHQLAAGGIPIIHGPKIRGLQCALQGDLQIGRDGLGDAVHVGQGNAQHPTHVPDGGPGLHPVEGHDLGHPVGAILLAAVLDDLAAPLDAEIGVDIGKLGALGVQKTLEEQLVGQRVELGDAGQVGHQASRRRAPARSHGDPLAARIADEVPDQKEVVGEALPDDHVQLGLQPGLVLRPGIGGPETLDEALSTQFAQKVLGRASAGDGETGQVDALQVHLQVAAFGHLQGVVDRLGHPVEGPKHLLARLEIELGGEELHAPLVVQVLPGLDADQDVLQGGVVPGQVMGIVGGHRLQAEIPGQPDQFGVGLALLGKPVVHQLDEEVLSEDVAIEPQTLGGQAGIVLHQGVVDLTAQATRKRHQALAVPSQQFAIRPGLVVVALQVGGADQLGQVAIALAVLGQQRQVEGPVVLARLAIMAPPLGHVDLASDQRLDACLLAGLVEGDGPGHHAMVGHGQGRHAQFLGPGDHLGDAVAAIQQAVLGVAMEMDVRHGAGTCFRGEASRGGNRIAPRLGRPACRSFRTDMRSAHRAPALGSGSAPMQEDGGASPRESHLPTAQILPLRRGQGLAQRDRASPRGSRVGQVPGDGDPGGGFQAGSRQEVDRPSGQWPLAKVPLLEVDPLQAQELRRAPSPRDETLQDLQAHRPGPEGQSGHQRQHPASAAQVDHDVPRTHLQGLQQFEGGSRERLSVDQVLRGDPRG